MRASIAGPVATAMLPLLVVVGSIWMPSPAAADLVTFTGTVTYQGTYSGDTLYVGVIDTVGVEDVTVLDIVAIPADPPPFSHPYSLEFDNTGVSSEVFVAAFLDVDGGGPDDVGGADILGWFGEGSEPTSISSASSLSGLDFALPRAEIHGTLTFTPDQFDAWVDVSADLACLMEGFRPGYTASGAGPYSINGIYAGTYCVSGEGDTNSGTLRVCFGDPTCATPTPITLTETEVRMGVDLDFTAAVPVEKRSWGRVKALYRE